MKFTDEDLKRLKDIADDVKHRHRFHGDEYIKKCSACKLANPLEALLARLEAAENCIKITQEMLGEKLWDERAWQEWLNEWRKAAGK